MAGQWNPEKEVHWALSPECKLASLAGKVLSGEKKPTVADAKKLAASVLTQAPDKKK